MRPSWLVARRSICSLPSFLYWLVATNRQSITLIYKHRIHSLKILYPRPSETVKKFGRWTQKTSLFSKCSNHFPTIGEAFSLSLAQRVYQVPLRMYSKSSQSKPVKQKKTERDKISNKIRMLLLKGITWKQRKEVLTAENGFNPIKSLLCVSLTNCLDMEQFVLVPASVYNKSLNISHWQSRNFQSINLRKIPRTKLIRLRKKKTQNCSPKQTL